jgi:hypothetical protein
VVVKSWPKGKDWSCVRGAKRLRRVKTAGKKVRNTRRFTQLRAKPAGLNTDELYAEKLPSPQLFFVKENFVRLWKLEL